MNGSIRVSLKCSSLLGIILAKTHVILTLTTATFSKAQKEINARVPTIHFVLAYDQKKPVPFPSR